MISAGARSHIKDIIISDTHHAVGLRLGYGWREQPRITPLELGEFYAKIDEAGFRQVLDAPLSTFSIEAVTPSTLRSKSSTSSLVQSSI